MASYHILLEPVLHSWLHLLDGVTVHQYHIVNPSTHLKPPLQTERVQKGEKQNQQQTIQYAAFSESDTKQTSIL